MSRAAATAIWVFAGEVEVQEDRVGVEEGSEPREDLHPGLEQELRPAAFEHVPGQGAISPTLIMPVSSRLQDTTTSRPSQSGSDSAVQYA